MARRWTADRDFGRLPDLRTRKSARLPVALSRRSASQAYAIWLSSWFAQSVTGWGDYGSVQLAHGEPAHGYWQFLGLTTAPGPAATVVNAQLGELVHVVAEARVIPAITQPQGGPMPDQEGKQEGPGTKTPDQAYKEGRSEDVQEGSLGADTGGAGTQKSRLPEGRDETGTAHAGGFAGQEADDSPDAGTVGAIADEGDDSPHAGHEDNATPEASADDAKIMDDAPAQQNADPGASVDRGIGQQPDYDATDVESKQAHPKTPSDMGSR